MTEPVGNGVGYTIGATPNTFDIRHAVLAREYGHVADPPDAADVLAMQLVLHIPKADPPARSVLLEAAARACVSLCLDERVGPGGEWHDAYSAWIGARIRKISRRARGGQWSAANDVPGVSVECGAQARAIVPGRVGDVDRRISRLQIGGTDVPEDDPGPVDADCPVLWVDASLNMTTGKAAAQVGHASMLLAAAMSAPEALRWAESGFACSVREADPAVWAVVTGLVAEGRAVPVRDAGFTEVAPGSTTVVAVFAGESAPTSF